MSLRSLFAVALAILVTACAGRPEVAPVAPTVTLQNTPEPSPTPSAKAPLPTMAVPETLTPEDAAATRRQADAQPTMPALYHPDPDHIWNRLFNHFYMRTAEDGRTYGGDVLDPLLWRETTYLLEGESHERALALLDEFLATNAESAITDPLKRAMFQRDMWAVFDWVARERTVLRSTCAGKYIDRQQELLRGLAEVMRRVALPEETIRALPDNYQAAVASGAFPASYQEGGPRTPFLPADLFSHNTSWDLLGRADRSPLARQHTELPPFRGRSVFLVFIRVPGGRDATLRYVEELRAADQDLPPGAPALPVGTEFALVRRMLLVDAQGDLVPSPIIESIQFRRTFSLDGTYANVRHWRFYEFNMRRGLLFAGMRGGLQTVQPDDEAFAVFRTHGFDVFEASEVEIEQMRQAPLDRCGACHRSGIEGVLSYRPLLADNRPGLLTTTTPEDEIQATIAWKRQWFSWQRLQEFWR